MMNIGKLLFGLLLVGLTSCSPLPPPLKIAVLLGWPTYEVIFIAQEQGLFAKYGVSVTPVPVAEYMSGLKLYKENKVEAAFMVIPDAITIAAEGVPTRFVYATDYSEEGDVIVGQPTLKSLNDLQGKKISFEGFNSFSHLLVLKLMEKAGLQEDDFQVANVDNIRVLEALDTGKIEAGHVYGAVITEALAKGYKILGTVGDVYHLMIEGLVVNAEVVKTRRTEVQGVVKALTEAMDWWQRFPEAGFRIIAKYDGTSKPEELATIVKGVHILTLAENRDAFKPNGSLFKGGQEITEFFLQRGTLFKPLELNTIFDDQFVNVSEDKL